MTLFSSLRSRVWLLVAVTAIPFFAYSLLFYLDHRKLAIARAEAAFQQAIHAAQAHEARLVGQLREWLRSAAHAGSAGCEVLKLRLPDHQDGLVGWGLAGADGRLRCGVHPVEGSRDYRGLAWFREVVERGGGSHSSYLPADGARPAGLLFAHPVSDEAGGVRAVAFAILGIDRLAAVLPVDRLPFQGGGALVSKAGEVLVRMPAEPGGDLAAPIPWSDLLRDHQGGGVFESAAPGGQPYLFGVAPLEATGDGFRVVVAASRDTVLAQPGQEFRHHLILLLLLGIASVLIGHRVLYHFLVRWTEGLHANVRRIAAGERHLRFQQDSSIRELREIDVALNAMLDSIHASNHALRTSQEYLQQALEGGNLGTWEWSVAEGTVRCNARFARMLGYRPEELPLDAAVWQSWLFPDDLPGVRAALESLDEKGLPVYECEFRIRHREGHWIWLHSHGWVANWQSPGKPARISGTTLDVTSRRLTEQQLRQRTEELAALVEAMPNLVWFARDADCRQIVTNSLAQGLFTSTRTREAGPGRVKGIRYLDSEGGEIVRDDLPLFRAAREMRPFRNQQVVVAFPGGRQIWLYGSAVPLFDDIGQVRGAVAAAMDISPFKRVEEALRQSQSELAQAQQIAHLGAWTIDLRVPPEARGGRVRWSDEMFRLLGYEPGEIDPSPEHFFERTAPDQRRQLADELEAAIARREPFTREYPLVLADGANRTVQEYVDFRYDSQGDATYCIGAVQDITVRKQVELELKMHRMQLENLVAERTYELAVAKEAAERANRTKSQFLANITHELRTPLSSLMLLAQFLAENDAGNLLPQQVEYARMIELSGNDLMQLIDELLDLAQLETGRLDIEVKSVAFPDVMQNVHRIHRHVAKKKGLEFTMEIDADVPASITTDPLRLQQLLRNLLGNAIKFTERGSVTLRIRRAVSGWSFNNPALANAETVIAFDVIDTGIGIDIGLQSRILGRQDSMDPDASGGKGTGLGLPISREIAARLGGEMALVSALGQGSTFTVYLPLIYAGPTAHVPVEVEAGQPEPLQVQGVPDSSLLSQDASSCLAGKVVLVIDRDEGSRLALKLLLEQEGIVTIHVEGTVEALEMLAAGRMVDAVVMDVMTTGIDAYEATRALREALGHADLPIIAVTALGKRGGREKCLAVGCSDYLPKSASHTDLLQMLRRWLAGNSAAAARSVHAVT